jgi:hypothetical protein
VYAAHGRSPARRHGDARCMREPGAPSAQLLREATVTVQRSHPNVVPVHDLEAQGAGCSRYRVLGLTRRRRYMFCCSISLSSTVPLSVRFGRAVRVDCIDASELPGDIAE